MINYINHQKTKISPAHEPLHGGNGTTYDSHNAVALEQAVVSRGGAYGLLVGQ